MDNATGRYVRLCYPIRAQPEQLHTQCPSTSTSPPPYTAAPGWAATPRAWHAPCCPCCGDELAFFLQTARLASSRWPGWSSSRRAPSAWAISRGGCWSGWVSFRRVGIQPAHPGREAVPRHRTPPAPVAQGADGANCPRPDLPALRCVPQAAQPLVPERDHAALLPPRRCHSSPCRSKASGTW